MALKKCTDCKKKVSKKAISCPNCGAPVVPTKGKGCIFRIFQFFGILLGITLLFGVLNTLLNPSPTNSTSTNSNNSPVIETQLNPETENSILQSTQQEVISQTNAQDNNITEEKVEATSEDIDVLNTEEQSNPETENLVLQIETTKNPAYTETVKKFCYALQASMICDNLQMRLDTESKLVAEIGQKIRGPDSIYNSDCFEGINHAFEEENNGLCQNTWNQYGCFGTDIPNLVQESSISLGVDEAILCSY